MTPDGMEDVTVEADTEEEALEKVLAHVNTKAPPGMRARIEHYDIIEKGELE